MKKGWRHRPPDYFTTYFRYSCFSKYIILVANTLILHVFAKLKVSNNRKLSRDKLSGDFFHLQTYRKGFNGVDMFSVRKALGCGTFL